MPMPIMRKVFCRNDFGFFIYFHLLFVFFRQCCLHFRGGGLTPQGGAIGGGEIRANLSHRRSHLEDLRVLPAPASVVVSRAFRLGLSKREVSCLSCGWVPRAPCSVLGVRRNLHEVMKPRWSYRGCLMGERLRVLGIGLG